MAYWHAMFSEEFSKTAERQKEGACRLAEMGVLKTEVKSRSPANVGVGGNQRMHEKL